NMRDRMAELVAGFDGANSGVFSTKDHRQLKDDYFFKSAENISFFFEGRLLEGLIYFCSFDTIFITEKAYGDDGCLKQPKELSINKVGHALHELDPVFKKFSFSESVASLFSSLGYKRPAVIQSMYIFKQPGLWLALEDATINNGCLWAIPGSHKKGLVRRMIRDENGTHFDCPSPAYDQKEFVPLEVKSGALVVIHGDLIHQSFENLSPASRYAFSLHVIDTEGCEWSKDN
ncbi:hypothetical protein ACJX0J_023373, partial [Zea mays]